MSYRFIRVTNYYPQYLKKYYSINFDILSKNYEDQYHLITSDSFESASSYSKNLNKIEGVQAFDIISNAEHLQDKWRKENKLPVDISKQDLILEQLKFYKPNVVWIDDFSIIDNEWKKILLKNVPSVKLLIGHICAPYNSGMAAKFKLFDIIFTCIPCFKNELEAMGINSYLLYHGFDSTILDTIYVNNKFQEVDFLFSGSLYTGSGFHNSRIEYIEKMLQSGIKMDLYCNLESFKKVLLKKVFYSTINILKTVGLGFLIDVIPVLRKNKSYGDVPIKFYSQQLVKSSKPPVFGFEMYQLLSKAKITFNIHGEVAEKCAGNIRLFEATGIGSCLVTDMKDNILDLFIPDKEIVTYRTAEECIAKVKWLIDNPKEREKIALAGRQRTLKDHTIEKRAAALHEKIIFELENINK
jgi:spore maturation protein CgeB